MRRRAARGISRPDPPGHGGQLAAAAALGAGRGPARRGPGALPDAGCGRRAARGRLPGRLPGPGPCPAWSGGRPRCRGRGTSVPGLTGTVPASGLAYASVGDGVAAVGVGLTVYGYSSRDRRAGVAGHADRLPGRCRHRVRAHLAGRGNRGRLLPARGQPGAPSAPRWSSPMRRARPDRDRPVPGGHVRRGGRRAARIHRRRRRHRGDELRQRDGACPLAAAHRPGRAGVAYRRQLALRGRISRRVRGLGPGHRAAPDRPGHGGRAHRPAARGPLVRRHAQHRLRRRGAVLLGGRGDRVRRHHRSPAVVQPPGPCRKAPTTVRAGSTSPRDPTWSASTRKPAGSRRPPQAPRSTGRPGCTWSGAAWRSGSTRAGTGMPGAYDLAVQRVTLAAAGLPWPHYFVDLGGVGGSADPASDLVIIAACTQLAPSSPPQPSASASSGSAPGPPLPRRGARPAHPRAVRVAAATRPVPRRQAFGVARHSRSSSVFGVFGVFGVGWFHAETWRQPVRLGRGRTGVPAPRAGRAQFVARECST